MSTIKEYLQDMSSRGDAQADFCLEVLAQNEKELEVDALITEVEPVVAILAKMKSIE